MPLDEKYWNDRYVDQNTAWDIGYPSTPLVKYIDQLKEKNIAILIPGGGNSYEAEYLLQQGFTNVTVIDISEFVAENLKKKYSIYLNKGLKIIHGDFFKLDAKYDLILEQTFFCALDPALRKNYVEKMQELLKPNGKIAGLLFNRSFDESPPFGGDINEYKDLFSKQFDIQSMEPCYNSIEKRAGNELFIILQRH
jgi:SAM-dependent methyltransferase